MHRFLARMSNVCLFICVFQHVYRVYIYIFIYLYLFSIYIYIYIYILNIMTNKPFIYLYVYVLIYTYLHPILQQKTLQKNPSFLCILFKSNSGPNVPRFLFGSWRPWRAFGLPRLLGCFRFLGFPRDFRGEMLSSWH